MALIFCPHCGKQVSDTVKTCIHCGGNLAVAADKTDQNLTEGQADKEEVKYFYKMTSAEQKALREEFYADKPDFTENDAKLIKQTNLTNVMRGLSWAVLVASLFLLFIVLLVGQKSHAVAKIVLPILIAIDFVVAIVRSVLFMSLKKYRRNQLICEKKFQKWLKEEKNTVYTVNFTPKQQKDKDFFDSVNPERARLEK